MVAGEVDGGAPELAKRALLEQRLIINATGPTTLRFLPPLIVTAEQVDDALGRLRALLLSAAPDRRHFDPRQPPRVRRARASNA